MYRLFTDTDTDVTPKVAAKYGYTLISMPYTILDKTYYPYEDPKEIDIPAFYDLLRAGNLPSTSAISEERYIEYFEPVFAAGEDILYVHFSAAMTATFDVMHKALEKLYAKYPERKLYEIDTKGISTISYAIAVDVGEMYLAGKTIEETMAWSETEVDKYAMYFFADDLKFFKKSGRVSGLTATMGTLLGIRPIIYMDAEGKMVSCGKEKGKKKALDRLMTYFEELGNNATQHRIYVGHTDAPEIAEELKEMLIEKYGKNLDIELVITNPTTGGHSGPNGVCVCFRSIHR